MWNYFQTWFLYVVYPVRLVHSMLITCRVFNDIDKDENKDNDEVDDDDDDDDE